MNLKTNTAAFFIAAVCLSAIGGVVAGATMDHGPVGPSGATGTTGATGPTGATGGTGPTGLAGTNGRNGVNGTNGLNGRNGTNYPYPIVSTLTFVSSNSTTYIQVNVVNASAPGMLTLNFQLHVSYSAPWTTVNRVNLHDSLGNTYSVVTSCAGPPNGHCYISGSPTNWTVTYNWITTFQTGQSFTLTVIGSDSTGLNFQSVYTVTF